MIGLYKEYYSFEFIVYLAFFRPLSHSRYLAFIIPSMHRALNKTKCPIRGIKVISVSHSTQRCTAQNAITAQGRRLLLKISRLLQDKQIEPKANRQYHMNINCVCVCRNILYITLTTINIYGGYIHKYNTTRTNEQSHRYEQWCVWFGGLEQKALSTVRETKWDCLCIMKRGNTQTRRAWKLIILNDIFSFTCLCVDREHCVRCSDAVVDVVAVFVINSLLIEIDRWGWISPSLNAQILFLLWILNDCNVSYKSTWILFSTYRVVFFFLVLVMASLHIFFCSRRAGPVSFISFVRSSYWRFIAEPHSLHMKNREKYEQETEKKEFLLHATKLNINVTHSHNVREMNTTNSWWKKKQRKN